ncbi:MAG: FGGY-family carbohydrate kinase [Planctomycetes bacterium]|nr:FGGY-family carbohydrate kinase [Planctomycetota bacterium]
MARKSSQKPIKKNCVLGVDVGTASARAGIFNMAGKMLGHASAPLEIHSPRPDFHEQSSEDIWSAVARAVRGALRLAGVPARSIAGLSFDATCSLVALDARDRPVTVSPGGKDRWNVVMWMDHRALEEAELVNGTNHEVLRYTGGRISVEMEPPKLLWIKKHLPRSWKRAARFLDLADFLTYRATGIDMRSLCTAVCKWTYLGHEPGETEPGVAGEKTAPGRWAKDFFFMIGLDDLFEGDRQGKSVRPMGSFIGGLTARAARELGLSEGVPVGVGIIDAHAGGLGLLGTPLQNSQKPPEEALETALALIGGTSSCHMAVSRQPRFIPGVWGPYYSAMVPGMWLTEGGQSASGSLVDHVIADSGAAEELRREARREGATVYEVLNRALARMARRQGDELAEDFHILPYFHGNRSPRADPTLRGVVSGLILDRSLEAAALRYLAAIQAIAYGTRHIIEAMNQGGFRIDTVLACGGGTKNPVWLKEHADITGCRLHLPRQPEAVLLGAAILGAVAGGCFPSLLAAMGAMGGSKRTVEPDPARKAFHDRKYEAFHRMYGHFLELRRIMKGGAE